MSALRDYQEDGLVRIASALARVRSVLAVGPTGSGKGVMIAHQAARAVAERGRRVLVLAHRREIVLDLRDRIEELCPRVGIILPGERPDRHAPVQVASTHTLLAEEDLPGTDTLIIDEAHHYLADEYRRLQQRIGNVPRVGYTATPQRADGRAMGDAFDELLHFVTYRELLAAGQIVPCDVLRPPAHTGMDLAQDPVDAYMEHAASRRAAFMFVRDVDTANSAVRALRLCGVPAAVISHETSNANRQRHLDDLRNGGLRVVVNAYTMTEGVDAPNVDTIILARNSEHAGPYVQMTGRALRANHGKERALLVDLHGVSHLHGMPHDDRPMSLHGAGIGREVQPHEYVPPREAMVLGLDLQRVTAQDLSLPTPEDVPVARPEQPSGDPKLTAWTKLKTAVRRGELSMSEARATYVAKHGRSAARR